MKTGWLSMGGVCVVCAGIWFYDHHGAGGLSPDDSLSGSDSGSQKPETRHPVRHQEDRKLTLIRVMKFATIRDLEAAREAIPDPMADDALAIVRRAGFDLVLEYLESRPAFSIEGENDPFDEALAWAGGYLLSEISVDRALDFIIRSTRPLIKYVGFGSHMEAYEKLALLAFKNRDRAAYDKIKEVYRAGCTGVDGFPPDPGRAAPVGVIVTDLRRTGMSVREIGGLFGDMGERFPEQCEEWFRSDFDIRVFGGEENLVKELEDISPDLRRQYLQTKATNKSTRSRIYIAENPWLTAEEKRLFLPRWVSGDPEPAMDWIVKNDLPFLAKEIRSWIRHNPEWLESWYAKQTDPEVRKIVEAEYAKSPK